MLTAMFWSFALLVTLASVVCGEVVYDVELLKAGEHGFANRIDSIINHGACVEVKNNFGVTPLIWAANNNHLETMKALINRGADVEAKANNGRTPIMWAATWGHVAIAEHLLSVGAKIDTADKEGLTALLLAVMNNHVEMVRLLLKSGADTNVVTSQGGTIFTIAAAKNNQDILNALACNRKNAGLGTCSSNDGTCEDELQSLSQRKHAGNHEQAGDLSIFFQIYAVLRIYGSFIVDLFSAIYMSARNGDLFVIPQFRKQDFDTLISSLPGFFNLPVVQYIIGLSVVSTLLHLLLPFIWNVVIDQALDKALELTDPKNRNKNKKKNGINRLHNSSLDFGELDIDPSVPQHSRNHDREQFKSPKELQTALESPKYNYNSNSKAVVMDLLAELRPTLVMTIPFLSSIPNSKVHSMLAKAMQSEVSQIGHTALLFVCNDTMLVHVYCIVVITRCLDKFFIVITYRSAAL